MAENKPGPRTKLPASDFWRRLMKAIECNRGCVLPHNPTALARHLQRSQGGTQKWYTSESMPDRETLVMLAKETGVSVDWLETGREPMYLDPAKVDPYAHAVVELLRQLPEIERVRMLEFIQFKLEHPRSDLGSTEKEAVEALKSQTGKHRKLS